MKLLSKLSDGIYKIEKWLATLLGILILVSLSAGVLYRYVLSSPLTWADETAIFSLVWMTFIGGSMSIKRQDSPTITLFMDKMMDGTAKKILVGIGLLSVLAFVAYIFYLSIEWLSSPTIMIQKSNSMQMPMIYAYLSVPVSFFFMCIHSLDLLVKNFSSKKEVL